MGKIWKIMKHLSRHVAAPKNTCRVLSADHSRASFLNSSLVAGSWNQKDVMTVDVLDRSVPLDWRKVFSIERDRVAKSSKDVVSLLNCAAYHPCSKCQFLAVPSWSFSDHDGRNQRIPKSRSDKIVTRGWGDCWAACSQSCLRHLELILQNHCCAASLISWLGLAWRVFTCHLQLLAVICHWLSL